MCARSQCSALPSRANTCVYAYTHVWARVHSYEHAYMCARTCFFPSTPLCERTNRWKCVILQKFPRPQPFSTEAARVHLTKALGRNASMSKCMFALVCTHVSARVHTWTFGRGRTHKDLRARKLHVSPRIFMPVRIHTCVHTHARASEHIHVPTHVFADAYMWLCADTWRSVCVQVSSLPQSLLLKVLTCVSVWGMFACA